MDMYVVRKKSVERNSLLTFCTDIFPDDTLCGSRVVQPMAVAVVPMHITRGYAWTPLWTFDFSKALFKA